MRLREKPLTHLRTLLSQTHIFICTLRTMIRRHVNGLKPLHGGHFKNTITAFCIQQQHSQDFLPRGMGIRTPRGKCWNAS